MDGDIRACRERTLKFLASLKAEPSDTRFAGDDIDYFCDAVARLIDKEFWYVKEHNA